MTYAATLQVHFPPLRATIAAVSRFNPGYGVARLDTPFEGFGLVVVNDETKGRIAVLNASPRGILESGVEIEILETSRGSEAHLAERIRPLPVARNNDAHSGINWQDRLRRLWRKVRNN